MRLVSWIGGILVVIAVGATVGVVSLQHRAQAAPSSALTASRNTVPAASGSADMRSLVAPHLRVAPPKAAGDAPVQAGAQPVPVAAAAPSIVVRTTQQALINADRARNGLGPLSWSPCLANVAAANASRIAAQGYLSHTNGPQLDLTCGLGRQGGENIGWYSGGINDSWMNAKFVASPEHYANIMGPYRYVATVWVVAADGRGYIAVEFG